MEYQDGMVDLIEFIIEMEKKQDSETFRKLPPGVVIDEDGKEIIL